MSTDQKEKTKTKQRDQETTDQKKEMQQQEKAPDKITRNEQKQKRKQEKRKNKKARRRIFPIWLRIIAVLVLSAVALGVGLMIGYGVIGDGNPTDALVWETWQQIIDIVVEEE